MQKTFTLAVTLSTTAESYSEALRALEYRLLSNQSDPNTRSAGAPGLGSFDIDDVKASTPKGRGRR